MLRYWLFFKQWKKSTCALTSNFNDSAQLCFAAGIYCLHGKFIAVWNFTSVNLTEVKIAPKWVSPRPKSCERWQWSYFTRKWNLKPVVNVLLKKSNIFKMAELIFWQSYFKKYGENNQIIFQTATSQCFYFYKIK